MVHFESVFEKGVKSLHVHVQLLKTLLHRGVFVPLSEVRWLHARARFRALGSAPLVCSLMTVAFESALQSGGVGPLTSWVFWLHLNLRIGLLRSTE